MTIEAKKVEAIDECIAVVKKLVDALGVLKKKGTAISEEDFDEACGELEELGDSIDDAIDDIVEIEEEEEEGE